MGIVYKTDLLEELDEKLRICDKHLSENPYVDAQKRVQRLMLNPCLTSVYYLNAIYNQEQVKRHTEKNKLPMKTVVLNFKLSLLKTYNLPSYILIHKQLIYTFKGETQTYYEDLDVQLLFSSPQQAYANLPNVKNKYKDGTTSAIVYSSDDVKPDGNIKTIETTYSFNIVTNFSNLIDQLRKQYDVQNTNTDPLYPTFSFDHYIIDDLTPVLYFNSSNNAFNELILQNTVFDVTFLFEKVHYETNQKINLYKNNIEGVKKSIPTIPSADVNDDLLLHKIREVVNSIFNIADNYLDEIQLANNGTYGLITTYINKRNNFYQPLSVQNLILKLRATYQNLLNEASSRLKDLTDADKAIIQAQLSQLNDIITQKEKTLSDDPNNYKGFDTALKQELDKLVQYKAKVWKLEEDNVYSHLEELLSIKITLYYIPSFWPEYYSYETLASGYVKENLDEKMKNKITKLNASSKERNTQIQEEIIRTRDQRTKVLKTYEEQTKIKPQIKQKQTELYQYINTVYADIYKIDTRLNEIAAMDVDYDSQLYNDAIREEHYLSQVRGTINGQLQQALKEYQDNLNSIYNIEKLLKEQSALQQLVDFLNYQISYLDNPDITETFTLNTDYGVPVSNGYTFSPNGLYKNLYIDTQPNNEWYDLKKELSTFRLECEYYLPDEIEVDDSNNLVDSTSKLYLNMFANNKNKPGNCSWYIPMNNMFSLFDENTYTPESLLAFACSWVRVKVKDKYGRPIFDKDGKEQTVLRKLSVQDGYAYIDSGLTITLVYTGIPTLPGNSILIPGVGPLYGALMAGFYAAETSLNIEKLVRYPYQNNIPGGRYFWVQNMGNAASMFTTQLWLDLKTIFSRTASKGIPIKATFSIYIRMPLKCGFPRKCGAMAEKDMRENGKCGLEDIWEVVQDLDINDDDEFNFDAYMLYMQQQGETMSVQDAITNSLSPITRFSTSEILHNTAAFINNVDNRFEQGVRLFEKNFGPISDRAARLLSNKKMIAEWLNNGVSLATNTWNIVDSIWQMKNNEDNVMGLFSDILEAHLNELYELIPPECRNVICNTKRKLKQKNIDNINNKIQTETQLNEELTYDALHKKFFDTVEALGVNDKNAGELATTLQDMISGIVVQPIQLVAGSLTNVIEDFTHARIFKACPKRRGEYLKNINPLNKDPYQLADGSWMVPLQVDIFNQFNMIISLKLINNVLKALNNCITKSIVNHNINASKLFPDEMRYMLDAANSVGDVALMARELKRGGLTLDSLFKLGSNSSILDHFVGVDVNNISLGKVYDLIYARGLNEIVNVDNLLQKDKIISTLQDTVNSAVSNNLDVIEKIKNGLVLNLNDQFKNVNADNMLQKTKEWAANLSLDINNVTTVAENAKDLIDSGFQDPKLIFSKVNKIISTVGEDLMKKLLTLQESKKNDSNNSLLAIKMKLYLESRKKEFYDQIEQGKNSSSIS